MTVAKRALDLALAVAGIVVLSPVFLLAAIAVRLSGPGPILFRQERVGRRFQPFRIYKFRTMYGKAAGGPPITVRGDRRITPVGCILRAFKIDELPQLINVAKGEMSLVGPRPELRQFVERFRGDYDEILTVRPGMTDEASIAFRHEETVLAGSPDPEAAYLEVVLPQKIALAKNYVRHRGIVRDLSIILRTLLHVPKTRRPR